MVACGTPTGGAAQEPPLCLLCWGKAFFGRAAGLLQVDPLLAGQGALFPDLGGWEQRVSNYSCSGPVDESSLGGVLGLDAVDGPVEEIM